MITIIFMEIALSIAITSVSYAFWQIRRRKNFLKRVIKNKDILEKIISPETLENIPKRLAYYLKSINNGNTMISLLAFLRADSSSQRRTAMILVLFSLLFLLLSYLLGKVFLVINLALFLLCAIPSISESAKRNALEHLLGVSLILARLNSENPEEFEKLIAQMQNLETLSNLVKSI